MNKEEKYKKLEEDLIIECEDVVSLVLKKNMNYGDMNISICGLKGIVVRLTDKVCRMTVMVLQGETDKLGESITDTFKDIVGYGLIGLLWLNGKWPGIEK